MSVLQLLCCVLWLSAMLWSLRMLRRVRDWRMGLLTAALGLMAATQFHELIDGSSSWRFHLTTSTSELARFMVCVFSFVGVVVIERMVADRRKVVAALEASEARFRTIFENAPVMIDAFDSLGRMTMWNRGCEKILGWSREEAFAAEDLLARAYPDPRACARVWADIQRADRKFREYEVRAKGGSIRHQLWADFRLPDGSLIAVGHDITDRKKAEEDLRAAHAELERRVEERTEDLQRTNASLEREIAERARAEHRALEHQAELAHVLRVSTMGEMVAAIAHEINQPLSAIVSYANGCIRRLQSGEPLSREFIPVITNIAEQGLRASEVVRRLRDFVAKAEPRRQPSDVNALVYDAVHLIDTLDRARSPAVGVELDSNLPEVDIDAVQIEQVLLNLIRNGLDSVSEHDGQRGEVHVQTHCSADGGVEISVSDRGMGVSASVASRIFDPFFSTKPGGLGMGLAISKAIVEAHGGRIWMTPNTDAGATFHFTLPSEQEPPS